MIEKLIFKLLKWETKPLATGKVTGVSHTASDFLFQSTLNDFYNERINQKQKENHENGNI
jgi:hypothetical protein